MITLIATNLIPLAGVLFFNWNLFAIVLIYWVETVIIIFYSFLRNLRVNPFFVFLIPFLVFFWYCFLGIEVSILCGLLGPQGTKIFTAQNMLYPSNFSQFFSKGMLWNCWAIFFQYGFDFFYNFLFKKQYLSTSKKELAEIYTSRLFILHFTLLFGGWLIILLKLHLYGFIMFIVLKTVMDLHFYNRNQPRPGPVVATI